MEKKEQKEREKKEQEARKKFKVSRRIRKKSLFVSSLKKINDLTVCATHKCLLMTLFLCVRQLVGPLQAIHQVKVHLDCKGSKTDLTLKQGECLDIISVQGNPEGKWLGRSQDGSSEWFPDDVVASADTARQTMNQTHQA